MKRSEEYIESTPQHELKAAILISDAYAGEITAFTRTPRHCISCEDITTITKNYMHLTRLEGRSSHY